jgi:hypothetical protein
MLASHCFPIKSTEFQFVYITMHCANRCCDRWWSETAEKMLLQREEDEEQGG